jgi:hypothetical protein
MQPEPFDREMSMAKSKRRRNAVVREFNRRYGDYNTGGCTGKKLVTSYRQMVIQIAAILDAHGPMSAKQLVEMGCNPKKTSGILRANY